MAFAEIKAWTILVGAVIGALAGTANLIWKFLDRRMRVTLHLGPEVFSLDQTAALHVSNNGTRPIRIADYGVILFSGDLYSFPVQSQIEPGTSFYMKGSTVLLPNEIFEAGADINGRVAGVYCRLIEGKLLTRLYQSTRYSERLWLRLKIWRAPG